MKLHLLGFAVIIPLVLPVIVSTNCRVVLLIWVVVLNGDVTLSFFHRVTSCVIYWVL